MKRKNVQNEMYTFIVTISDLEPYEDEIKFMLRQQVLKLYRDILRSIKQVPDKESQRELRQWARHDFEKNKHHTEEITIKMMIKHGERSLKELQQTLDLSSAK